MKNVSLSAWARKIGVSKQIAHKWAKEKPPRIKARNPAPGVWYIDENEPRPVQKKPWEIVKKKFC